MIPIQDNPSCIRAWLAATNAVMAAGEAYNVVIDVANPTAMTADESAAVQIVDNFLRKHDKYSISTVANTLFPKRLYNLHGSPAFYDEYLKVIDSLGRAKSWGRYFERMVREQGPKDGKFRILPDLIAKIKSQKARNKTVRATHELPIYDPIRDRKRWRNGPCLSFLSFKWHSDNKLSLTAMYRNHSYVTRSLGNLIGLGRLLSFVASETNLETGSLTCISTHAEIDTGPWTKSEVKQLLKDVSERLNVETAQQVAY